MKCLNNDPSSNFVVIDYLQLLDQRRTTPSLNDQVQRLAQYAQQSGAIIVFLCQIDRTFDGSDKTMPKLSDLRLPNPLDLSAFSTACFMHRGKLNLERLDMQ